METKQHATRSRVQLACFSINPETRLVSGTHLSPNHHGGPSHHRRSIRFVRLLSYRNNHTLTINSFSSLVRAISGIKPKSRRAQASRSSKLSTDYPALDKFKLWVARLHSQFAPLPEGTTAICLRLLFPEDDIARKYDIQEPRMTTLLAKSFGLDMSKFEGWQHEETSGCLGDELALVLDKSCIVSHQISSRARINLSDALPNRSTRTSKPGSLSQRSQSFSTSSPRSRRIRTSASTASTPRRTAGRAQTSCSRCSAGSRCLMRQLSRRSSSRTCDLSSTRSLSCTTAPRS